ncbi:MAG: C40 family peptidase [Ferruginibacter sp.]|nr:C40 family peptidase [Ferruginibacter sp.]
MMYALCSIPTAPLRLQPNHTAEMVSQLLFGERCIVEEKNNEGWCKVVCKNDNYMGWCLLQQLSTITEEVYNRRTQPTAEWLTEIEFNDQPMQVPFGSELDVEKLELLKPTQQNIAEAAHQFLNTSYLWGGKTVFGTDCSGFTQTVFKLFGIYLPRDAKQQILHGEEVPFLQQAHSGDLAFFDEDGSIVHVGILLSNSHIIHASGKVRIDKIDTEGIINTEDGSRSKQKLRLIKRYF